ncbi:metal-dependent hydrolase [Salinicoccus halodurans]|uniref:Membrane protein n=1 Tax=Salinicoccus halodurans TaxID=407035 RepID=A0A0F7HI02_9STAP|nr:metal-dependent hydrolase [Salinicoccus halodurans]AKG73121.1 membrane protein [Salinicoccus halodurans]SFK85218.1 inner membrane protein [Salinicoccus halodurans]
MTGKTHIVGGIASSLAFAHFSNFDPVITVGAGIIGALIPDICHGGSKMGKALPILSKIINLIFGHRSFTHSLLFLVLASFLMDRFLPYDAVKNGLMIGMISHLILDMATKSGIQLFFPISFKVKFPITIRTGSMPENLVFSILSLVSFYFGFQLLNFYI